ncbi:MAG: hypothetical protein DMF49_13135, partial [Acidobacteria bacterium]
GFKPNGTACSDSNACTTNDTCQAGACVGGAPPTCDDGNVCTIDSCNPQTGCSHTNQPNGTTCDDGHSCTQGDSCQNGTCTGTNTCTTQIAPTGTTCSQFESGTAQDLTQALYTVKANKVNSVAPGVFFYYSQITAPSASFTITVPQSNNHSSTPWPPIALQNGQAILYDSSCNKSPAQGATSYDSATGTVTIQVNGATPGAAMVIGNKYDTTSVVGANGSGKPTVRYTYQTKVDGTVTASDFIDLVPKK